MDPEKDRTPANLLNPADPIPGLAGQTIGDFWRWAYSDILSNRNRSIFAEFLVGVALGVAGQPRVEWASVDLSYKGFGIEVKSAAYCQSWFQKKLSSINFGIRKAIFWDPDTGLYQGEATRSAKVYVFCLYTENDKKNANVLDIAKWEFYVVSTERLNEEFATAKSLSLSSVKRVAIACKFEGLKDAVDRLLAHRP